MNKQHFIDTIQFFSIREIKAVGTDIRDVDRLVLENLNRLRRILNRPILITSLTNGVHAPKSLHYIGKAVDCVIDGIHPNRVLETALDVGFRGIGLYSTHWHFDVRDGGVKLWKGQTIKPMVERRID